MKDKIIIWYKDRKLLTGIILVVASTALGLYGKGLLGLFFVNLVNKLYKPFYLLTGLSVYGFSWILLFLGIFLVGWEAVKMIRDSIRNHVRKTYHYTKGLPKKGYDYTKELSKKGYHHTKELHKRLTK